MDLIGQAYKNGTFFGRIDTVVKIALTKSPDGPLKLEVANIHASLQDLDRDMKNIHLEGDYINCKRQMDRIEARLNEIDQQFLRWLNIIDQTIGIANMYNS
jgi:hypothetical protein